MSGTTEGKGINPVRFIKEYISRIQENNATGLAAQLAYYFLLSLFPFLIFSITLLGYTPITLDDVLGMVNVYAPDEAIAPLEDNLRKVLEERNTGLLSFGIIATLWSASTAMNALVQSLNHAYDVQESRSFVKSRIVAAILTMMMIFVIVVSLTLSVFGQMLGRFIFSFLDRSPTFILAWEILRWVATFSIMVSVFACIYYWAPNKPLKIKEVIFGALFTATAWEAVSYGFSYYVNNFGNYSATYGSLGGVIVLMIWFYLTALNIILGGILNVTLHSFWTKQKDLTHNEQANE
jgi:membrane protein